MTKFGIFTRENFPLVDIVKQIIANIEIDGKNHSERASLVHTELSES